MAENKGEKTVHFQIDCSFNECDEFETELGEAAGIRIREREPMRCRRKLMNLFYRLDPRASAQHIHLQSGAIWIRFKGIHLGEIAQAHLGLQRAAPQPE